MRLKGTQNHLKKKVIIVLRISGKLDLLYDLGDTAIYYSSQIAHSQIDAVVSELPDLFAFP